MRALRCLLRSLPLLVLRARLALLLHVAQLLLAATVLLPLSRAFAATFGESAAGAETGAGRFVEYAWQDWRLQQGDLLAVAERSFSAAALVGLLVSFTLLSAATFALLATPGSGSTLREFLTGAGRLAGRFLRLLVLFAAACVALAWIDRGLTIGVERIVVDRLGRGSTSRTVGLLLHLKTLIALLLLGWTIAATGLAKARLAVEEAPRRFSVLRAFASGWRGVLARPFSSALLASFGPLMLLGAVAAYGWLRGRLGAGAETGIGTLTLPTWIGHLVIAQFVGWLMQATTIVWTGCFLEFRRPADRPEPAPLLVAGALASALALGLAAPARAQESLPAGPFLHADRIEVTLDADAKSVAGRTEVTFTNPRATPAAAPADGGAPADRAVRELVFHLYMNAFSGPATLWMRERGLRLGRDPLAGLPDSALGSCTVASVTSKEQPLAFTVDETLLRVALPEPLAPGASTTVTIAFTTRFASAQLTGRGGVHGDHFDGMQWYPRLAQFRDGRFDAEPFHADTEFFGDFGSFDVTLTAPERFVVGATGRRVEPARPDVAPARQHRFVATAVHDFAWCADPNFVACDATFEQAGRKVAITYLCQPYALEKKELVLATAKLCLQRYGEWFAPYPYDTLTIDGVPMGLAGGMEYPTLFTISQGFPNHLSWLADATEEPAGVTAHEFGHQYWQGMLASDETREAWLDEGVNTYVTTKIEQELWRERTSGGRALQAAEWSLVVRPFLTEGLSARLFGRELGLMPLIGFESSPFTTVRRGDRSDGTLLGFSIPNGRRPGFGENRFLSRRDTFVEWAGAAALADPSFELRPGAYRAAAYSKPALALATLEAIYGWDALRDALREYVRRFRFAHPGGGDFLGVLREVIPQKTANRAAAPELDRYLREMWLTSSVLDLAVATARSRPIRVAPGAPVEFRTEVVVENRGTMQLPSRIRLRFADAHDEWVPWPADRRFLVIDRVTGTRLRSAEIDPDHALLLDVDWTNNGRAVERNDDLVRRFDVAALFWIESALTFLRTLSGP